MDADDPLSIVVLGLLVLVMLAVSLVAPQALADPPQPTPASASSRAAAPAPPPLPACYLPHCAEVAEGQAAPAAGYWYSAAAHLEVGELGGVASMLLEQLLDSQRRETAAESDRAAADATVERCADGQAQLRTAPGLGPGLPDAGASVHPVAWVAVAAVLVGGTAAALDYWADAGPGLRYAGAAAGAIVGVTVAWAW